PLRFEGIALPGGMLLCRFAAYNYFTSLHALYCTFTSACAPETGIACMPASRAPPRVMESVDWPPALAMNVRVITEPCPDIPPDPGGRVAVTCKIPAVLSSR